MNILKQFKPDYILNFAAESHVDRSINDPLYFIKNNIYSTSNLFLAYLKLFKKKKIKFFHISTDEVYGSTEHRAFKEDNAYEPSSPYSASKGSTDLIAMSFNRTYSTNIKIINLTNNYGPYQYPEKFIPTLIFHFLKIFLHQYMELEKMLENGFMLTIAVMQLGYHSIKKNFEKINIGSSQRVSNIEIAKIVFKIMKQHNLTNLKKIIF